MLWMLAAVTGFSFMAALMKYVSQDIPFWVVMAIRNLFGVVPLLPWLARNGLGGLRTRRFPMHFARATNGFITMALFMWALTRLPLADVVALGFTRPLWMILIAFLVFGEITGWKRGGATVIGFVGVLVVAQPGANTDPGVLAALGYGLGSCLTVVLVKYLSGGEPAARIVFYHQTLSLLMTLPFAGWNWTMPALDQVAWIALSAFSGTAGHFALTRACLLADATILSPMEYSRLPLSAVIGWVLFAEIPGPWTWIGSGIIAAATLYIAWLDRRDGRPAPKISA
ncbi:MAG: DMT family transporter [Alphaproteobacteria bacterium]|nr:DMT family transporter [Alphaproteobacteria bacterium]